MESLAKRRVPPSTVTYRGVVTSTDSTARRLPNWTQTISQMTLLSSKKPANQSAQQKRTQLVKERYEQLEKRARPRAIAAMRGSVNNNLMMPINGAPRLPRIAEDPSPTTISGTTPCTPRVLCELPGSTPYHAPQTWNPPCQVFCELAGTSAIYSPKEKDAGILHVICELP